MARKFIDLEEAAKLLGVTPDTLTEMRERQKIYGYRDGGHWKFKPEDVEKLIADRDAVEQEGEFAELDEDPDSILLSEVELGGSNESTSSTIIGGKSSRSDPAESDIELARPKHDSDVDLDSPWQGDAPGGSDVLSEGAVKPGSGLSPLFDELDTLDLDMDSAADSGISSKIFGGSAVEAGSAAGTSDIALGSDMLKLEGSNLALGDDALELGEESGVHLSDSKAAGGSAIDLSGDEDGDLVLGGSSHGGGSRGDLSRSGDSGISLLNPADSGLSLESAPLELGGSAVESLELGEEDMILVDEPASQSAAARTRIGPEPTDDDFLLTPLEEAGAEESDSGSQVIALEGDVEFEEAAASGTSGLLDSGGGLGGLLEEDLGEGLGAVGALSAAALTPAAAHAVAAGPAGAGAIAAPEPAYSGWNVASLAMCAILLLFIGMFMFDLLRNMWSWNNAYPVNSSLMSAILSWFEK
jgi:excisionase family DNA binding protein